jgi:putative phosphoesterase
MLIGLISDAHGNPFGLDACIEALSHAGVERMLFLGDSVGYLPWEEAVLARLHEVGAECIRGNHDDMLLGRIAVPPDREEVYGSHKARDRVSQRWLDWMAQWPLTRSFTVDGCRILLAHGSPADPLGEYLHEDADLARFDTLPYDLIAVGHTHRPWIRSCGAFTFVNTGSCGLPRDVGNQASCVLLDTIARRTHIIRASFDAEGIITQAGHSIDQSVAACLRRADAPRRADG